MIGCNNGCKDENACNDGMDEPCKYSDEQESLLEGEWLLVDIRDINEEYLFSASDDTDYPLDVQFEFIAIEFNDDNTCEIETGPSDISSNIYESDWSINALNFRYAKLPKSLRWKEAKFYVNYLFSDIYNI